MIIAQESINIGDTEYFEIDGSIAKGKVVDIYMVGEELWISVQFADPIGYQEIRANS